MKTNEIEPEYCEPLIKNYNILSELMEDKLYTIVQRSKLLEMGFDLYARTHTEVIRKKHLACIKEYAIMELPFRFPASYKIIDLSFYK